VDGHAEYGFLKCVIYCIDSLSLAVTTVIRVCGCVCVCVCVRLLISELAVVFTCSDMCVQRNPVVVKLCRVNTSQYYGMLYDFIAVSRSFLIHIAFLSNVLLVCAYAL
jgi:hypothetical protein